MTSGLEANVTQSPGAQPSTFRGDEISRSDVHCFRVASLDSTSPDRLFFYSADVTFHHLLSPGCRIDHELVSMRM
jgi:hypothetical protein